VSFAYPAAAWAFLALLGVLAIHLLRRRPRTEVIATLFLLEAAALSSPGGRRLQRLRQSLSLWLQLATAALLAWLLMGPRLVREETVQKVAVVLDSTASLGAFRERALAALSRRVARWEGRAARTEWLLVESTLRRPALYVGRDGRALTQAAAKEWDPRWPAHDLGPALDQAREAVGPDGLVVLVTDHAPAVPAGVDRVAVGAPFDNVGFAGAAIEPDGAWKAVVKNHGRGPASRGWSTVVAGRTVPGGALTLGPGEVRVLSGPLPAGEPSLVLALDADGFALDDRLPLVRPRPKTLRVQVDAAAQALPFVTRFLATLEEVAEDSPPDLAIVVAPPGTRPATPCAAIVLRAAPGGSRLLPSAAGGAHPLVQDLDWSGLLAREAPAVPHAPGDETLVWAGTRPLVLLGVGAKGAQLIADFPALGSSAERSPAFPLLLHRFAESVRQGLVGREQVNVDTGSELSVALRGPGPAVLEAEGAAPLEAEGAAPQESAALRAPLAPGTFRVREGTEERVLGAARFTDAAEADFTLASSLDEDGEADGRVAARNRRDHPLIPWATLLAGALAVLDWALLARHGVR
jgi:hypothetical protein